MITTYMRNGGITDVRYYKVEKIDSEDRCCVIMMTSRNGYSADQVSGSSMTVSELMDALSSHDGDEKVVLHLPGSYGANYFGAVDVESGDDEGF